MSYKGKWKGEVQTINLSDNEFLEARRQQSELDTIRRNILGHDDELMRARRCRSWRKNVPCKKCAILQTCEKRKRYALTECKVGFVAKAKKKGE